MSDRTCTDVMAALTKELVALNSELEGTTIDPDATLLDVGYLDSLSATELLAYVERTYGVYVAADRLVGDLPSMRRLAAFVVEQPS